MKIIISALIVVFFLAACGEKTKKSKDEAQLEGSEVTKKAEVTGNWISLFDGTSTEGWRGFNSETLPEAWLVEDGTLKSLGKGGDIGGDIVYGAQEFENFELVLEWKISEGGNSGIFYHVQEGNTYKAPYENSPEYQVIDQLGFPQKLKPWQSIAADYGMHIADNKMLIVKKAGEWNTTRIIFTPEKVEHWLNGNKVVEFKPWSEEWYAKKREGKWKGYPSYGVAKKGFVGLQDHGSFTWFKNIKIREL